VYQHYRHLFSLLLLAACSTAPKALLPDGSHRVPVNSPQAVEQYRAGQPVASRLLNSEAAPQRIARLERQLAELRQRLSVAAAPNCGMSRTLATGTDSIVMADGVEVQISEHGLLFRIPQPLNRAEFTPGTSWWPALTMAAAQSSRIDVRGRTDARHADRLNQRLAEQRALRACRGLIEAGIAAAKIHTSFLAAGDTIADNTTAAGQARNRRIEIALQGLPAAALQQFVAQLGGTAS